MTTLRSSSSKATRSVGNCSTCERILLAMGCTNSWLGSSMSSQRSSANCSGVTRDSVFWQETTPTTKWRKSTSVDFPKFAHTQKCKASKIKDVCDFEGKGEGGQHWSITFSLIWLSTCYSINYNLFRSLRNSSNLQQRVISDQRLI